MGMRGRVSSRGKLIAAASARFRVGGYKATSVPEIVAAAGVPDAAFDLHFQTKERLAVEVLNAYWASLGLETLLDRTRAPAARLRNHFRSVAIMHRARGVEQGCVMGVLLQEADDDTPLMRKNLTDGVARWTNLVADAIRDGQAEGGVDVGLDAPAAARFLVSAWGGVAQRMKLTRDDTAMNDFFSLAIPRVLGLSPAAQSEAP
uniref:Transcriptional regulator, TetR family n=1 Tax=Caulobacter sp. (strain K31) TaxID=366602 RepID=B0T947_CAUSK